MMKSVMTSAAFFMAMPLAAAQEPLSVQQVVEAAKAGVTFVDDAHIMERLSANPDLILYDVRTEQEYALGRMPGATWMPRGRLEFDVAKSVRAADAEIILYCKTGSRAALAKKALEAQGYTNVSAHGGFESWAEAGGLIETDLGTLRQVEAAHAEDD